MARKQYLSVMIPDETREYLETMRDEHGISIAEAVRALFDLGRDARDAADGQMYPARGRWVTKNAS